MSEKLRAIEETIERWKRIRYEGEHVEHTRCPLCKCYYGMESCPVYVWTGASDCKNTV